MVRLEPPSVLESRVVGCVGVGYFAPYGSEVTILGSLGSTSFGSALS